MNKKWYEMNEAELEAELETSAVNGLTRKVASRRVKKRQNLIFRLPHGSFSSYLKDMMSDSSSLVLIIAALIAGIFENTVLSYTISAIILLNCFSAVFTYVKAHRVLEEMCEYSLPGAKVIREGHLYLASMSSLVVGDLIYLSAGDIVPADARIIASENFFVSEKGITGNVSAIRKSPQNVSPDNKSAESMFNMVFATSVVLKGNARAIVVETGEDTLISKTEGGKLEFNQDNLDIFFVLKKYASRLSLSMLALVFVIMFLEITIGLTVRGMYEIFLGGMSLAVAAMTEFYTAFGYIIVACTLFGARTDKGRKSGGVILKNINSIEKLRDINCIVFKKNGILTQKNKLVASLYANAEHYEIKNTTAADGFRELLEAATITTGMYTSASLGNNAVLAERSTTLDEDAIIECAKKYGLYNISLEKRYPILMHIRSGKNSHYDFSAVQTLKGVYVYIKGYARSVLEACNEYYIGNVSIPIDNKLKLKLLSVIDEYEKTNVEVYAIAKEQSTRESLLAGPNIVCRSKMTLMGFITLKAPLYDGTAMVIDKLKGAGIKCVLNTPNASPEDIQSAKSLGICKSDTDILTERLFESMKDETLAATVSTYSVYSGLKNSSLRKILNTLKNNGYNVGYCAESLSDISVMECAHIGYAHADIVSKDKNKNANAPNADNFDALRFKADVIIPTNMQKKDGGIAAVKQSILTAKLIYKNIINMLAYLVNVQFARLFIVLYSVFTQANVLTPVQILFGGLIFDFLSVLVVAFTRPGLSTFDDYNSARTEMKKLPRFILRNALFGIFWAAMTIFVPLIMTRMGYAVEGISLTTAAFMSFSLLQLIVLCEIKRYDSIFKVSAFNINPMYVLTCFTVFVVMLIGFVSGKIGNVFGLLLPGKYALIATGIIVVTVLCLHELYKYISKKNT